MPMRQTRMEFKVLARRLRRPREVTAPLYRSVVLANLGLVRDTCHGRAAVEARPNDRSSLPEGCSASLPARRTAHRPDLPAALR